MWQMFNYSKIPSFLNWAWTFQWEETVFSSVCESYFLQNYHQFYVFFFSFQDQIEE